MSFNFLDIVKGYFSNDLINKAAGYLGESNTVVKKGLDNIIPLSLAGIAQKAESSPETVLNFAKQAYNSGIANNLPGSFLPGGEGVPKDGPTWISNIFGDKFGSIANTVSGYLGLKGATTASLFGTIIPLALGLLGKHAHENSLSPGGLSSLLSSQKNSIMSTLPSELNLGKLFGSSAATPLYQAAAPVVEKKKNMLMPILVGLLILVLLWWLFKTCNKTPEVTPAPIVDTVATKMEQAPPPPQPVTVTRESIKLKLINGVELEAYKGGIEELLLAFINDTNAKPGKDNWFDFRDLNFKFGTAEIIPESRKEVDNIVKILQAYPKVKIKLGGYTDKVGDETANKKLSKERATAVADALKAAGVGSQVVSAEGYGSQFAKYAADAPEEDRIKDRHVSVSVREK